MPKITRTANESTPKRIPVKAVWKAMALLDRIALGDAAREGVALAELAAEFGWPLNTVHNLLTSLTASSYVAQTRRGIYVAGSKCRQMRIVAQCAEADTIERILALLDKFVEQEGEGCICTVLAQGRRLVVGAVESSHAVRISHATVEETPFFGRATGRMLAAMADTDELKQIVEQHGMPEALWNGIANLKDLNSALRKIRQRGVCITDDSPQEMIGLAVPVSLTDGSNWGVLGSYAPRYRCPSGRQNELAGALRSLASELAGIISR